MRSVLSRAVRRLAHTNPAFRSELRRELSAADTGGALGEALESLIDRHGLGTLVETLAAVCYEKADHVEENWQNAATAKTWKAAGRLLDTAAEKAKALVKA